MLVKNKRRKLFARRAFILAGIKSGLLLSLVGRLYYLQILKSEEYKTISDSNRIRLTLIPPLRGKILDRFGNDLATNKNYYRVLFDPQMINDKRERKNVLKRFTDLLSLPEDVSKKIITQKYDLRKPTAIYEHLTWEEVATVEVNSADLFGIYIDVAQMRNFALGNISPHVVGYLGPVSEDEIKANQLLNHPDFKVGRSGLEKSLEPRLRGKVGIKRLEVNAHGVVVRELSRETSVPGEDIKVSLCSKLQEFAGNRLAAVSGSTVVMNIHTGEVLAMAASPGFDPSEFTYGVSQEYWKKLINDPEKPLINKALSNQYPPGSTFKLMVTLAGLKSGVDPEMTVFCPGYFVLGNRRFHCWKEGGHGTLDMTNAIMHSCNTYFYTVAKIIGIDAIEEMAHKFNLGRSTGIILPNEKTGIIPGKRWKWARYKQEWQMGDTLNTGIGQGFVLATPLQLSLMVARIASGNKVLPQLISETTTPVNFEPMDVNAEHFALVREGMRRVVNVPGGTAYGSRIQSSQYSMVGKTGTSQVISKKSMSNLLSNEKKWAENHALFVGYGPIENPKYSISVVVEHGGAGSAAAAPVGRDIMEYTQKELG